MRFRPASRAVLAGASLFSPWAVGDRPAQAQVMIGSSLIPTSSVVTSSYVPTSYFPASYVTTSSYLPTSYLATSSVFPTSYVVPTSSVVATGSILETGYSSYYPTSYVGRYRGGLFRPRRYVERTSYYGTSTGFLNPTAYYSPTSYITPTTYLSSTYLPTSYLTSSYVPTSYIPTSYLVPTMATSAILPTTYLPGSFVAPTSYLTDDGLIATSASAASICCDSGPAVALANPTRSLAVPRMTTPTNQGSPIVSQPSNSVPTTRSTDRTPTATINSTPGGDEAPAAVAPGVADPAVPAAPKPEMSPPPAPTAPDKPEEFPIPKAGTLKPQVDQGPTQSTSYKPVSYRPIRNVLRGRVVSYETNQPEEAVSVVLVNPGGAFDDRRVATDADGMFKVTLPDGDWAVKVTMPSGTVYTVGRGVTASGGQVVDRNGRYVGELLIKR